MVAVTLGSPRITALCHGPGRSDIDLSPYLISLDTEKDIGETAGVFDLQVQFAPGVTDGWPDVIQPMDVVDITARIAPDDPRIHRFRGLVDTCGVNEVAGDDGTPSRVIVVTGRDFGKLLGQYQIFYPVTSPDIAISLLKDQALQTRYGLKIDARNARPNVTNQQLFDRALMAGFLTPLQAGNPGMATLRLHSSIPPSFGYNGVLIQDFQGSFDDLWRQYQSPPWGEYFLRDDDDAPRLYLRPAPFYAADGRFCWSRSAQDDVRYCLIRSIDVIEADLQKSDAEVFTYFLSNSSALGFDPEIVLAAGLAGLAGPTGASNPFYDGQVNPARERRFGFRPLQAETPWVPLDMQSGAPAVSSNALALLTDLNGWLVRAFGFAEFLRSGTITCRGVHGARVGDYLVHERTGEILYVQALAVEWSEGSPLRSTYQVIRGQSGVEVQPTAFPVGSTPPAPALPTYSISPPPPDLCRYAPGSRDI